MMMAAKYFLFFLFLPFLAQSQVYNCANTLDQLDENALREARLFYHREHLLSVPRTQSMDSVGISLHYVRSQQGKPNIPYAELEKIVEQANTSFQNVGLHFYICGSPRYSEGPANYSFNAAERLNTSRHIPNTINIYLVDGIVSPNGGLLCGLSKFPFSSTPENRYILLAKDCALTGVTLIHELGHFYGLLHTHETRFGFELVNGTNCRNTGDLVCDTPADPNLTLPNSLYNCDYIGSRVDANGQRYQPAVQNFMSYAPYFCQQTFSRNQESLMRSVAAEENAYLNNTSCTIEPDIAITQSIPNDLTFSSLDKIEGAFQISTQSLTNAATVTLNVMLYEDETRRLGQLLHEQQINLAEGEEVINLSLDLSLPKDAVSGTYYLITEIDADFELVERTERNNTLTLPIKIDNQQLADLSVFPNPSLETAYFFFRHGRSRGPYTLRVLRPDGVVVWREENTKVSNEILRPLDVSQLPTGIYLVHIEFENMKLRRSIRFFKK